MTQPYRARPAVAAVPGTEVFNDNATSVRFLKFRVEAWDAEGNPLVFDKDLGFLVRADDYIAWVNAGKKEEGGKA